MSAPGTRRKRVSPKLRSSPGPWQVGHARTFPRGPEPEVGGGVQEAGRLFGVEEGCGPPTHQCAGRTDGQTDVPGLLGYLSAPRRTPYLKRRPLARGAAPAPLGRAPRLPSGSCDVTCGALRRAGFRRKCERSGPGGTSALRSAATEASRVA